MQLISNDVASSSSLKGAFVQYDVGIQYVALSLKALYIDHFSDFAITQELQIMLH